jgi:hypothetical protein
MSTSIKHAAHSIKGQKYIAYCIQGKWEGEGRGIGRGERMGKNIFLFFIYFPSRKFVHYRIIDRKMYTVTLNIVTNVTLNFQCYN